MERAFLLDKFSKSLSNLKYLCLIYLKLWSKVRQFLSYFDWIYFCRHFANIELIKQKQIYAKYFNPINWLHRQRFVPLNPFGKTIIEITVHLTMHRKVSNWYNFKHIGNFVSNSSFQHTERQA